MMDKNHSCYSPVCCNAPCFAEWNEEEPCWGDTEAVDEDVFYDEEGNPSDYSWVHGCQGHINGYGGPYVPKELVKNMDSEKTQPTDQQTKFWTCTYCKIKYPMSIAKCECGTHRDSEQAEVLYRKREIK